MNLFRRLVFIVTVSLVFCSCKDWWPYGREGATKFSKGSIYKNLEDKGDYGLFLRALEITNYKKAVNESDLLTVFAPNDAAFREFMTNELGVSDLSEVPLYEEKMELLRRTVAFHIIQFSWSLDDFLGFTMSADPDAPRGDGSVYKYKTLSKDPIYYYRDPISRRNVQLYNREKYLPVFSTNFMTSRRVPAAEMEAEYKRMYPNVQWRGSDNRLYVGDAAVIDQAVPADNGYLYTIDKVAKPQSTIYTLIDSTVPGGILAENHKLFAQIVQRLNTYSYDPALTAKYALPGDSLFHLYTYVKPTASSRIPAIASEWTYEDELGSNIEYSMSWATTAMIPTDAALDEWIRENLAEWVAGKSTEQAINELPYNTLYHIVIAHMFDKRKLTIPYQVFNEGVVGAYGELFKPAEEDVDYVNMAANGIVYGMNKVNNSVLFERFTRPLFTAKSDKTFQFFAEGFSKTDKYMTASSATEFSPYTLFVVNDANLQNQTGVHSGANPLYHYMLVVGPNPLTMANQRKLNTGSYAATGLTELNFMMSAHISYGYIPTPEPLTDEQVANNEHHLRYYKMQKSSANSASQYIYNLDGQFYDELDNPLGYIGSYGEDDGIKYGIVHELREAIRGRNAKENVREAYRWVGGVGTGDPWKPASKFKQYMKDCGILGNNNDEYVANGWNASKDLMFFAPSNAAIEEALAMGVGAVIPYYDSNDDGVDAEVQAARKKALENWCKFYIFDRYHNNIEHYPLPGLDPRGGQTNEPYEHILRTTVDYTTLDQAKYCKVGWDPANSFHMYLKDKSGTVAKTLTYWTVNPNEEGWDTKLLLPSIRGEAGMMFVIDKCFPYSTMTPGADDF